MHLSGRRGILNTKVSLDVALGVHQTGTGFAMGLVLSPPTEYWAVHRAAPVCVRLISQRWVEPELY
jgi:hypothetical protein